MKPLSLILVAFVLAGCAGTPQVRATNALAIACSTYAVALDQLTPKKASLSASTVARVDAANALVKPACASDSKIDPAEAVSTVQSALTLLRTIREAL
jgi:hypothetical protein